MDLDHAMSSPAKSGTSAVSHSPRPCKSAVGKGHSAPDQAVQPAHSSQAPSSAEPEHNESAAVQPAAQAGQDTPDLQVSQLKPSVQSQSPATAKPTDSAALTNTATVQMQPGTARLLQPAGAADRHISASPHATQTATKVIHSKVTADNGRQDSGSQTKAAAGAVQAPAAAAAAPAMLQASSDTINKSSLGLNRPGSGLASGSDKTQRPASGRGLKQGITTVVAKPASRPQEQTANSPASQPVSSNTQADQAHVVHPAAEAQQVAAVLPQVQPRALTAQPQAVLKLLQPPSLRLATPQAMPKRSLLLGVKQHPISKPAQLRPLAGMFTTPARTPGHLTTTPLPHSNVLQPLARLQLGEHTRRVSRHQVLLAVYDVLPSSSG